MVLATRSFSLDGALAHNGQKCKSTMACLHSGRKLFLCQHLRRKREKAGARGKAAIAPSAHPPCHANTVGTLARWGGDPGKGCPPVLRAVGSRSDFCDRED